jgi:hypothetical protein
MCVKAHVEVEIIRDVKVDGLTSVLLVEAVVPGSEVSAWPEVLA